MFTFQALTTTRLKGPMDGTLEVDIQETMDVEMIDIFAVL